MKPKIVFENEQFLIVDKPSGLVVNRSETIKEETLQDQLSKYFKLAQGDLGIGNRAGIVHRLDRETSGLLVVAKTNKVFEDLCEQFKNRRVEKEYIALVHGFLNDGSGDVRLRIGRIGKFGKFGVVDRRSKSSQTRSKDGRETETAYKLIERFKFRDKKFDHEVNPNYSKVRINYLKNHGVNFSLVKVFPKTGRTHQIRVALKSIGHPVVSDLIYTPSKLLKFDLGWCPRLFLHAVKLKVRDPKTTKIMTFESPLPNDLKNAMLNLLKFDN